MKIKLLSLLCFLFSLYSCNSWLDIELANKVDENKLFKTEQGFQEALAGVYSELASSKLYGGTLTFEFLDVYAQYYSVTSTSRYTKHDIYDYKYASVKNIHATMWKNMYNCIAAANNIIAWADRNPNVMSPQVKKQVVGEAIAIRAFLHFDLYRLFSPDVKRDPKAKSIPYNKIFGVSLPPMYTTEAITQLILNDLLEAEELLAEDEIVTIIPYAIKSDNKNAADRYVARFNLYAVKAMIARLHQARGDNGNAIKYAKEVLESGKFRLLDFSSVNQSEKLTDILFSDEHILSFRNKGLKKYTHDLFYEIKTESSTTAAPMKIQNSYEIYEGNSDDMRLSKWFNQMDFKKYDLDNSEVFYPKVPIIKLSEMYLIIAECSYNSDPNLSKEYVNMLRNHRIINNTPWTYITKDAIIEEMKREYLSEGQLWYAYKRNNKALSNKVTGDEIPASNDIYVFPLPDKEIENGNNNTK